MYFDDHPPPHFHATYGEDGTILGIDSLTVLHGHLPRRAPGLVVEWASLRQDELREAGSRASRLEQPGTIAPLHRDGDRQRASDPDVREHSVRAGAQAGVRTCTLRSAMRSRVLAA